MAAVAALTMVSTNMAVMQSGHILTAQPEKKTMMRGLQYIIRGLNWKLNYCTGLIITVLV